MGETPKVGVGVIIVKDGKILVGKRTGSHAQFYSIPGGHVDVGEKFEDAAVREVLEETGLEIKNPRVISLTNNLKTFKNEGKHYISLILLAEEHLGEPKIMEPNKCEEWLWCDPMDLPLPHFDASEMGVACYLEKTFYKDFHSNEQ